MYLNTTTGWPLSIQCPSLLKEHITIERVLRLELVLQKVIHVFVCYLPTHSTRAYVISHIWDGRNEMFYLTMLSTHLY